MNAAGFSAGVFQALMRMASVCMRQVDISTFDCKKCRSLGSTLAGFSVRTGPLALVRIVFLVNVAIFALLLCAPVARIEGFKLQ